MCVLLFYSFVLRFFMRFLCYEPFFFFWLLTLFRFFLFSSFSFLAFLQIFVISHDEHLINAVCNELWVLDDKKLINFDGDFEAYKKLVRKKFNM